MVEDSDPTRGWNPLDFFWKTMYPILNPRPDASPAKLSAAAPIWDLPSAYGNVHHNVAHERIPFFVHPDYYTKLTLETKFPVVHREPPFWMTVLNFNANDAVKAPFYMFSGPGLLLAYSHFNNMPKPSTFTLFAAFTMGCSAAFTASYYDSENRLQGYFENEQDVKYWTERAEWQRKVERGEIDPRHSDDLTSMQQTLFWMLGPKTFDLGAIEKEYLATKTE